MIVGGLDIHRAQITFDGFQTAPQDADTGNVILGPRQYDPTTRHFTTSDSYLPAAMDMALRVDPLTGNQYIFAAANPVAHHDDGHSVVEGEGDRYQPTPSTTDVFYDKPYGHHVSQARASRDAEEYRGEAYSSKLQYQDFVAEAGLYIYRHAYLSGSACFLVCFEVSTQHGKLQFSGGAAGSPFSGSLADAKFAASLGIISAVPEEQSRWRTQGTLAIGHGATYMEGNRVDGSGQWHGFGYSRGFSWQAGNLKTFYVVDLGESLATALRWISPVGRTP